MITGSGGTERHIGIDGLRGIAVLAVVFYHLEITGFFEAGFLGVDVFFVISGFLITALLLREYETSGRLNWRAFLSRRTQRLFPAVFILIVLATAITFVIAPDASRKTVDDLPAALTYTLNWWQIFAKQPYFETQGAPPIFKHLWSLAIEGQYYLVWPAIFYLMLKLGGPRVAGVFATVLAAASSMLMAYVYSCEGDSCGVNRAYLGSDTHAAGILVGSALGCVAQRFKLLTLSAPLAGGSAGSIFRHLGLVSFIALGLMMWHSNEATALLFLGGFLLTSILTGIVIVSLTDRDSILSKVLSTNVVQWFGTRSYSIYLWHWPIFVWLRSPFEESLSFLGLTVTKIAITAVSSEVSYRLFEKSKERPAGHQFAKVWPFSTWAYPILTIPLATMSILHTRQDSQRVLTKDIVDTNAVTSIADEKQLKFDHPPNPILESVAGINFSVPEKTADAKSGKDVIIIGDSVMLGAREGLLKVLPGIRINAIVGRQFSDGLKLLDQLRQRSELSQIVVIHLGTNGYIDERHFHKMLFQLKDRRQVIVVNIHANRRWTAPNNEIIERASKVYANVALIPWDALTRERPGYFVQDGIHLTAAGIVALSNEVARSAGIPLADFLPIKDSGLDRISVNKASGGPMTFEGQETRSTGRRGKSDDEILDEVLKQETNSSNQSVESP